MSQTYDDTIPASTEDWDDDLPAIKNNFAALKSAFSGSSAPSNTVGGMPWQHSTASKGRRIRNIGDTAWLASLLGDASQKMYVYRNDTCDGWLIDTSLGDRVLAIKDQASGGNAYDVNGGTTGGSWTWPGHTLAVSEIPSHRHTMTGMTSYMSVNGYYPGRHESFNGATLYTSYEGGGGSHSHGGTTFRPAAAVGTLQYPDLT